MNYAILKQNKGVSLPEIIIATMILAVAVISIAGMIGFTHRSTAKDFRNLTAIHLLESTMRSALAFNYETLDIKRYVSDVHCGTYTLHLGEIASQSAKFFVSLDVRREPVSFNYMPIRVDIDGFVASAPSTWLFGEAEALNFTNSTDIKSVNYYRIKKLTGSVEWKEPERGLQRRIQMVSYITEYAQ